MEEHPESVGNGEEFGHWEIDTPETAIYYAHLYSSCERGLNEKQNSLIRRFFPKGRPERSGLDPALAPKIFTLQFP